MSYFRHEEIGDSQRVRLLVSNVFLSKMLGSFSRQMNNIILQEVELMLGANPEADPGFLRGVRTNHKSEEQDPIILANFPPKTA